MVSPFVADQNHGAPCGRSRVECLVGSRHRLGTGVTKPKPLPAAPNTPLHYHGRGEACHCKTTKRELLYLFLVNPQNMDQPTVLYLAGVIAQAPYPVSILDRDPVLSSLVTAAPLAREELPWKNGRG